MAYPWNYGAFPQTFSDPSSPDPATKINGDGDPIDVIDVGKYTHKIGDIIRVKVVGALALIDEGETDWKILTINVLDPKAPYIFGLLTCLSYIFIIIIIVITKL
jgi:inorganic pyrophosphatase